MEVDHLEEEDIGPIPITRLEVCTQRSIFSFLFFFSPLTFLAPFFFSSISFRPAQTSFLCTFYSISCH